MTPQEGRRAQHKHAVRTALQEAAERLFAERGYQQTTVRAQEWILLTQMALEIEAAAAHEIVLCDRSVLDNYCYLVHAAGARPLWEQVLDEWLPTYDLLVWVPLWTQPSYDGVRAADPGFQRRIEELLGEMITARGLDPLRLAPDRRDLWGDDIMGAILPTIEPTLPLFPSAGA